MGTTGAASGVHPLDDIRNDLELDHDEGHYRTRIFAHHDTDRPHPPPQWFRYPEIVSFVQRELIYLLEAPRHDTEIT